jgi:hypothetical protein
MLKERIVKIDNLGKFLMTEFVVGLKNYFYPIHVIRRAFSGDPYELEKLQTADDEKPKVDGPMPG